MKRLKELREKKGLTIRQLADELGVKNYSIISRYELGKTDGIKYDFIKKLCDYFNVTPNYLLGYESLNAEETEEYYTIKIEEMEEEFESKMKSLTKAFDRTLEAVCDELSEAKDQIKLLKEIVLKQSILLGGKASEFREKKNS